MRSTEVRDERRFKDRIILTVIMKNRVCNFNGEQMEGGARYGYQWRYSEDIHDIVG